VVRDTTELRGTEKDCQIWLINVIVKDHHGYVQVETEPEKGTVFSVFLPCTQPGGVETHGSVGKRDLVRGHGETILLADDEKHVRMMIASVLKSMGFEVIQAEDGYSAARCYQDYRSRIHLCVFDIDMPKCSGLECLQ